MSNKINTENLILAMVEEVGFLIENTTITNDNAIELFSKAASKVQDNWGGMMVYIPKGVTRWRERRNEKIKEDFNGENQSDLARKYGLSLQAIYSILRDKKHE